MPMNPEVKKKWIEALRSGKYKQTKGALHRTRVEEHEESGENLLLGYCCLGVLCAVQGLKEEEGTYVSNFIMPTGEKSSGYPSASYMMELGVPDNWHALADMNDRGAPFSTIADYIEENY